MCYFTVFFCNKTRNGTKKCYYIQVVTSATLDYSADWLEPHDLVHLNSATSRHSQTNDKFFHGT